MYENTTQILLCKKLLKTAWRKSNKTVLELGKSKCWRLRNLLGR